MGNIGKREQYYLMLLGIVLAVGLIYFFGIRNLGFKHDELVAQRAQLQQQIEYYENLKAQNDVIQNQINQLKVDISEVEGSFLPYICSEAIEQYVLKTFEDAGCPYLVSVTCEDVPFTAITLPDGTVASDVILDKRITLQYSTTDGFNIPEYNRNISVVDHGVIDEAMWNELIDSMAWQSTNSIVGYNEFISALKTLESENSDCIKINEISITTQGGFILLNAKIDFFSTTFNQRVSEPSTSAPYITWAGEQNINTEGGYIGHPFVFDRPNSDWYGVIMSDDEALAASRPFATYYSEAIFSRMISERGLEATLGLGDNPAEEIPAEE